jgi:hypothetical protein
VHLRGVALGLISNCWHVPIIRDVLENILRLTNGLSNVAVITAIDNPHRFNVEKRHEPAEDLTILTLLYGWDANTLSDFRNLLSQADSLPCCVSFPPLTSVFSMDLGVPDMDMSFLSGPWQVRVAEHTPKAPFLPGPGGKPGALFGLPPVRSFAPPDSFVDITCVYCKTLGHHVDNCPSLAKQRCMLCGAMGHNAKRCPADEKKGKTKKR